MREPDKARYVLSQLVDPQHALRRDRIDEAGLACGVIALHEIPEAQQQRDAGTGENHIVLGFHIGLPVVVLPRAIMGPRGVPIRAGATAVWPGWPGWPGAGL